MDYNKKRVQRSDRVARLKFIRVFGNQSSISMKSVAEIYEVWCFLCLKQILEQDLGFELVSNGAAKLSQNDFEIN